MPGDPEHFPAKREPVRRGKCDHSNRLERVSDSEESETALEPGHRPGIGICAACGSAAVSALLVKNGFGFSRCQVCGFVFADPMPTPAVIEAHYTEHYRQASAAFYPKAASRMRRAQVKALRLAGHVWRRDVLDLGCGGGFMAEGFRRLGARASGLDISPGAVAYACAHFPRCRFFCEDMASLAARGETFDFVFTTELFEHLRGVEEVMAFLSAVVRPGGTVFLATPDAGHRAVPTDFATWDQLAPPEHIQLFTKEAMCALFARHGFGLAKAWPKRTPALALFFKRLD